MNKLALVLVTAIVMLSACGKHVCPTYNDAGGNSHNHHHHDNKPHHNE